MVLVLVSKALAVSHNTMSRFCSVCMLLFRRTTWLHQPRNGQRLLHGLNAADAALNDCQLLVVAFLLQCSSGQERISST